MATHLRKSTWLAPALLSLAAIAGCCCQAVPLPDEYCCPTDARRMYFAYGEEAVRRCPLGPDHEFYGLKPTCWREWPEGWQCNGCVGMPYVDPALCGDAVAEAPAMDSQPVAAAPDPAVSSNPFRSDSGAAELPLPPQRLEFAPTQSAPTSPSQPMLTMPPALEDVPSQPAPTNSPPTAAPPAAKERELKQPFVKHVSAELPVTPTLTLAPPANASADRTAVVSRATASTEPVLNQPQLLPLIEDAQPIALKEIMPKWQPPKYIPHAITATALIKIEKAPAKVEPAPSDAPPPTTHLEKDPSMSNRIKQHLMQNLQL